MNQTYMRRVTDRLARPLDAVVKTITLVVMAVGGILFLGKKSQAVETHSTAIALIQTKNASQDSAIVDIRESLKASLYLVCARAQREDPTLSLPAECNKVIAVR